MKANKEEIIHNTLSKEKCMQAILKWDLVKGNYDSIKSLIQPNGIFSFSYEECNWLNTHNANDYFHTYSGVYDNKLIFIIVPIDKLGKEVDLPSYLTSAMTLLNNDLNLTEEIVIKKTKTTTLSKDLQVKSRREEIELPYENEPSIRENKSINEILTWRNECLDWFYYESKEFSGQRIFKTFKVPLADLVRNSPNVSEVVCLFGFRKSSILDKHVPTLIFVSVDKEKLQAKIVRSDEEIISDNTEDFASPCPPFCRDDSSFDVFN